MNIGIVGLGLIGGSLCKAIKKYTDNICVGFDLNNEVINKAITDGAIDRKLTALSECDIVFVCLHPTKTIEYILDNKDNFKKNSIVCDVCGIKQYIINSVEKELKNVKFVGCHPMAGRQYSGYDYSVADLFMNASFIITKTDDTDGDAVEYVSQFAKSLKFSKIVVTTPEIHDRTIAYTSQLAHIVSSAYVKSPTLKNESGFSAGSFRDLTRVAYLNADMWTDIFMQNSIPLCEEIEIIIKNLTDYLQVLKNADAKGLRELLEYGSKLKEEHNSSLKG